MRLGRLATGALMAVAMVAPVTAAPLFPDVPENHWAVEAVRSLAGKGYLEGYADGTFKGDRCMTRWEMASVIARVLARCQEAEGSFATKAELEELRRLANNLRPELDALGTRVESLENQVVQLDKRTTELERISFYGRMETIAVSNIVKGPGVDNGDVQIDWTTGRYLADGEGLSALGLLGVNIDISDDFHAGAEFAAYASEGKADVCAYWGTDMPFSCNLWTASNAPNPWEASSSHTPFTRMVLDSLWLNHEPSGTRFIAGSFRPRYMGDYIANGARNPNLRGPAWLPFYGFNITGNFGGQDSDFHYEGFYSRNPSNSLYGSHSFGGTVLYNFAEGEGQVSLNCVEHRNERINDGLLQGTGLIPLPTVNSFSTTAPGIATNSWLGTHKGDAAATANTFVGPQAQFTWGLDASYNILPDIGLYVAGKFASSQYNPDTSKLLYNEKANGNMYQFGLGCAPIGGLQLDLNYQSVDPDYDPFISQYCVDPMIPVFLPYGSFYSGYYQMHDYINLPNNRQGFKFSGTYKFNEDHTHVGLTYANLRQVKATTPEQVQTVGNIEPVFGILFGGGNEKGYQQGYGIGAGHTFDCGLNLDANYFHYDITRKADLLADNMDLKQNLYRLDLSYPINDAWRLRASYVTMNYAGPCGEGETNISQHTPGIGVDYQFTRDISFSADYRYIDFNQKAYDGGDFTCNQIMLEMKMDF